MSDEEQPVRKEALLQMLVQYAEGVRQQIRTLEEDYAAVRRSIDLLSRTSQRNLFNVGHPGAILTVVSTSKWQGLRPQAATLAFLEENADRWWKASQIANQLKLLQARKSEGKNYGSVIAGAVRRLRDSGDVVEQKNEEGVSVFRLKKQEPGPRENVPGSQ